MDKSKKMPLMPSITFCISIIFLAIVLVGCATFPLHNAIRKGDVETAKLLIEEENSINAKKSDGWIPHYLCFVLRPI